MLFIWEFPLEYSDTKFIEAKNAVHTHSISICDNGLG